MKQFDIKKILIPTDFSDTSLKAIDHAILLAKLSKAQITLLHVMEDIMSTVQIGDQFAASVINLKELEKDALKYRKKRLDQFVKNLKNDNFTKVTPLIVTGRTHIEILKTAKKINADIIIMGTHGVSGFREYIVGSNAYRVVKDSECPVLSVQQHTSKPGFKNILVPFSDQPHSREKVNHAIGMAKMYKATLSIVGIDTEGGSSHFKKIELEAKQIKKIAEKQGITCNAKVFSEGFYADLVLQHAKDVKADLITVMSDVERQSIADFFREKFVERIINHSTIPVMSIKPTFNPDTIDLRFY